MRLILEYLRLFDESSFPQQEIYFSGLYWEGSETQTPMMSFSQIIKIYQCPQCQGLEMIPPNLEVITCQACGHEDRDLVATLGDHLPFGKFPNHSMRTEVIPTEEEY